MSWRDDGGQAFPSAERLAAQDFVETITSGGMSLRDWFAGQALAGLITRETSGAPDEWARVAFRLADAMLAARKGKP
jgi:hypothetical protein